MPSIPSYFIAVHNEPYNYPSPRMEKSLAEAYTVLSEMVAYADRYNIKLTLMLSPSWVDYILSDGQRQAQVMGWKANGHELAAHHHSIYHGNWDGYTDQPFEFAVEQRGLQGKQNPEQYYGTIFHSFEDQAQAFYAYADFLHGLDPEGANSLTLAQAIEGGILSEVELDAVTLEETSIDRSKPAASASDLCGDGVCDQLEQNNAALCPVDCGR